VRQSHLAGLLKVLPHVDAPDCPNKCGGGDQGLGTPIRSASVTRWEGPDDATLHCPCCGIGWAGTPEDLARAEAGYAAWLAEMNRRQATTP
jgi:hypothetical protein